MNLDYTGELDIGELRAEEVAAEYAADLRQDDLDDAVPAREARAIGGSGKQAHSLAGP